MLLQRDILHSIMQILQVLTLIDNQVTQRHQAVIAHNVEDWQLDFDVRTRLETSLVWEVHLGGVLEILLAML